FPQRVPAVPRPADRCQADPAVVRRIGSGLDHVRVLLPGPAARWVRLRPRARAVSRAPAAAPGAHRAAWRKPRGAADRRRRGLEAIRRRGPELADPGTARSDRRAALLPAIDDEPARAGLVCATVPLAVPPLRALEPRVACGAPLLSGRGGTARRDARAGTVLVVGLRALRSALRRGCALHDAIRGRSAGCPRAARTGTRASALAARPVGGASARPLLPPPPPSPPPPPQPH